MTDVVTPDPDLLLVAPHGPVAAPAGSAPPTGTEGVERRHVLDLYREDSDLVDHVSGLAERALAEGGAVVAILTGAHLEALEARLRAGGADLSAAAEAGRYVPVDAQEMLSGFLVGARLELLALRQVVDRVLERATAGGRAGGLHVLGEGVALLWDAGLVAEALELEAEWDAAARRDGFFLYCGYSFEAMAEHVDLAALHAACELHSGMVPPVRTQIPAPRLAAGTPPAPAERWQYFLPFPRAIRGVRAFVAEVVSPERDRPVHDDAVLVASELATNALRHVEAPFAVGVRTGEASVTILVRDLSSDEPSRRLAGVEASSGRGIAIVERLAARWGTEQLAEGKVVWAELATAGAPPR